MTEEDLARLGALCERMEEASLNDLTVNELFDMAEAARDDIGPLLTEVWRQRRVIARLREALEEIQTVDPDEKPDGTILGYLAHDAEGMAKIACEALEAIGKPI